MRVKNARIINEAGTVGLAWKADAATA